MRQILVYADSLSWGIIPGSRRRLDFTRRWPGALENLLATAGQSVRIIEDCLNGRRSNLDDPTKPGRNGLVGLAQRIEIHSPLALVILMLGTNDFQSMHCRQASDAAQGVAELVEAIRGAPVEPDMPIPPILIVAPPALQTPRANMVDKFAGGEQKCAGLAMALQAVALAHACYFFDAGSVTPTSPVDGVHLDADQHVLLAQALAEFIIRHALPAA